jgi:short-subunit dehydrogenase
MAHEQVVVITGASSGIGRDVARRFAKRHARLVLVARRREALEQTVAECRQAGAPDAIAVPADISDETQLQAVVDEALARFGRIDVWINDAGVDAYGPLDRMQTQEIRRLFEINTIGTALGTRAALRAMKLVGHGTIVNVSSLLGEVPQPYASVYSASKAAIRALSAAVRSELALEKQHRIHVSTVMPATIDTPIFRQAANHSGRKLRALPPVYPVSTAGKAIMRAAKRHPAEVSAGAAAAMLKPMHRAFPRMTEAALAMLTAGTQFKPGAARGTSGNLVEPFADADASVSGGWGGGIRHRTRQLFLLALVGVPIWWLIRRMRQGAFPQTREALTKAMADARKRTGKAKR